MIKTLIIIWLGNSSLFDFSCGNDSENKSCLGCEEDSGDDSGERNSNCSNVSNFSINDAFNNENNSRLSKDKFLKDHHGAKFLRFHLGSFNIFNIDKNGQSIYIISRNASICVYCGWLKPSLESCKNCNLSGHFKNIDNIVKGKKHVHLLGDIECLIACPDEKNK